MFVHSHRHVYSRYNIFNIDSLSFTAQQAIMKNKLPHFSYWSLMIIFLIRFKCIYMFHFSKNFEIFINIWVLSSLEVYFRQLGLLSVPILHGSLCCYSTRKPSSFNRRSIAQGVRQVSLMVPGFRWNSSLVDAMPWDSKKRWLQACSIRSLHTIFGFIFLWVFKGASPVYIYVKYTHDIYTNVKRTVCTFSIM